MTTDNQKLIKALTAPFAPHDIEWRISRSGLKQDGSPWATALAYVTNRAIMIRLDETFGPLGWANEFRPGPLGGVVCGITVLGETPVTKWDGSDNTDVEGVKGGLSSSMKRAAVQWGIGRYLYRLPETFVEISAGGKNRAMVKVRNSAEKVPFKWDPPTLPAWALPSNPEPDVETPEDASGFEDEAPEADPTYSTSSEPTQAPQAARKSSVPNPYPMQSDPVDAMAEAPVPEADYLSARMPFGKHKGMTIAEILKVDGQYVRWIHGTYEAKAQYQDSVTFRNALDSAEAAGEIPASAPRSGPRSFTKAPTGRSAPEPRAAFDHSDAGDDDDVPF